MFAFFRKRKQTEEVAARLYAALLEQARMPVFYEKYGVPDTFDGRFELLLLHGFLVWDRLRHEGRTGRDVAQALFDVMFRDMDMTLRNIGVGDLSVPHHIKRMMKAFKGRALAYETALAGGDIGRALRRNLFGTVENPDPAGLEWFASYLQEVRQILASQATAGIMQGILSFRHTEHEQEKIEKQFGVGYARMVA